MLNNINLIYNQLILNTSYFLKNKKMMLFIFIPIFISALFLAFLIPEYQGFPIALELSLIPSLGIVFATLSFNVSNSTMYKNIKVSSNNRFNFNIAIYIFMLLTSILILFLFLFTLQIFAELKILETSWLSYDYSTFHFQFFNRAIWIPIISTIEISSILFAMSFFYTRLFQFEKGYFILLMIITILALIFGGGLNSVFWPHTTTKFNYMYYQSDIFSSNMFPMSLAFPFYPSGQLSYVYSQFSQRDINNGFGQFVGDKAWENLRIIKWQNNSSSGDLANAWRWNTVLLLPVVWTTLFGLLGIIASHFKKTH